MFGARFDLRDLKLSGEPQPLIQDIANQSDVGANFSYSETGTLAYVSQGPPQRRIFWLDSTGNMQPLQSAPGLYAVPRFSPDGTRVVTPSGDKNRRLWDVGTIPKKHFSTRLRMAQRAIARDWRAAYKAWIGPQACGE